MQPLHITGNDMFAVGPHIILKNKIIILNNGRKSENTAVGRHDWDTI
jgi:hypothetical protein